MTKLLVAAGMKPEILNTTEVIDLNNLNSKTVCDGLPNLPLEIYPFAGYLYNGTTPIICGASNYRLITCSCFSFEHGRWNDIQSVNFCRYGSASAIFSTETKEIIFVTGGKINLDISSKVEAFDGNVWSADQGPML